MRCGDENFTWEGSQLSVSLLGDLMHVQTLLCPADT